MLRLRDRKIDSNSFIVRRGFVSNDLDGTPLLINFKGEGFRVSDTAVSLWNMCNGISFQDLVYEVLLISSDKESRVRDSLRTMLTQMNRASIIKIKNESMFGI
jgi:hypothetical protein